MGGLRSIDGPSAQARALPITQ